MLAVIVARALSKSNPSLNYFVLVNEYGKVEKIGEQQLIKKLQDCEIKIDSIHFRVNGPGQIEILTSNGSIDRYNTFDLDTGEIKRTAVVLGRIEKKGELKGYMMYMPDGSIKNLKVDAAVKVYKQYGIANGKLYHNGNKELVSSINGSYQLITFEELDDIAAEKRAELKAIRKKEKEARTVSSWIRHRIIEAIKGKVSSTR